MATQSKHQAARRIDVPATLAKLEGRWAESHAARLGHDRSVYDDEKHHGCPNCGQGRDTFRHTGMGVGNGACICEREGVRAGDGLAWQAHCLGLDPKEDFPELIEGAVQAIGETVVYESKRRKRKTSTNGKPAANGEAARSRESKNGKSKEPVDPAKHIRFRKLPEVENRCLDAWADGRGLPPGSPQLVGCRNGTYRGTYNVVIWEVWGERLKGANPVGFVMRRMCGGSLPVWDGSGSEPTSKKTKQTAGSMRGLVGQVEELKAASTVWIPEGEPALVAIAAAIPEELRETHCVIAHSGGTAERFKPWMTDFLKGKTVCLPVDADEPGVRGAKARAKQLAESGIDVRLIELPYEVKEAHGEDVEDWLREGHTFAELLSFAENAGGVEITPDEISNFTERIVGSGDDERKIVEPKSFATIAEEIDLVTGGWPKRVGGMLFAKDCGTGELLTLKTQSSLFAYLLMNAPSVRWKGDLEGAPTKSEMLAGLQLSAEAYAGLSNHPHFPPIPGVYYNCDQEVEPGDGKSLEAYLDFYSFASPLDRQLGLAGFCTLFWGGATGSRPVFTITASGRGQGKTSFCKFSAELCGGLILWKNNRNKPIEDEIVAPQYQLKRVLLLDNVKSSRFSDAEFEALITSDVIQGRQLYIGAAERKNYLVVFVTANSPSFCTDISQRVVEIKMAPCEYSKTWETDIRDFIAKNRDSLIRDVAAFYQRPLGNLTDVSRFGLWDAQHISRLEEPDEVAALVRERRAEMDVEAEEGDEILRLIDEEVERRGFGPRDAVFVSTRFVKELYDKLLSKPSDPGWAGRKLNGLIQEKNVTHIERRKLRRGNGFIWRGADCVDDSNPPNLEDAFHHDSDAGTQERIWWS